MKKFFLLAAAAVMVFASCSKNDQPEQREAAIAFSGYTGRAITKANSSLITENELGKDAVFNVYAYNTGANDFTGNEQELNVFMNKVAVTYNGNGASTASNYTYSPLRYWPNDEASNKLSFFAYYPGASTNITPATNGWGAYSFTANTDPDEMEDFLFSEVAADQVYSSTNSGTPGVVNMVFHHALAMVKFKVNTDKDYTGTVITLKSLKVAAVNTKGTFTPSLASPFGAWSGQGTTAEFTVYDAGTGTGLALSKTAAFIPTGDEDDDAFLMVPQTLSGDVKVTVVYTVKTGEDAEVENTAEVVLNTATYGDPAQALKEWKMNNNIIYTFTVGLKPIEFIAEVKPWDETIINAGVTVE